LKNYLFSIGQKKSVFELQKGRHGTPSWRDFMLINNYLLKISNQLTIDISARLTITFES